MRRFLIVLAVAILLAVSISVGVITAEWPRWRQVLGFSASDTVPAAREQQGR